MKFEAVLIHVSGDVWRGCRCRHRCVSSLIQLGVGRVGEGGARESRSLWSFSLVGDPPLPSNVFIKTGFVPFLNKKFKEFSRTCKETFPIFQGLHLVQKRALRLSFLVLPQHEQFYPDRSFCVCSFQTLENLCWIKLAPKFKDFPAPTAIFKDFQGLELFISNFMDFQGLSRCVRTLVLVFFLSY